MVLFENLWLLIVAIVVMNLHILPRLFRGLVTYILEIVNVGLHIGLICAMLWCGIPFEEATLVVMASLMFYTLYYLVFGRRAEEGRVEK